MITCVMCQGRIEEIAQKNIIWDIMEINEVGLHFDIVSLSKIMLLQKVYRKGIPIDVRNQLIVTKILVMECLAIMLISDSSERIYRRPVQTFAWCTNMTYRFIGLTYGILYMVKSYFVHMK